MLRKITAVNRSDLRVALTAALLVLIWSALVAAVEGDASSRYFKIQVVDSQTGRGVPLVELRTTNNIRYFTDSNGIVAFCEPGLMDREVFFFVESHGYEFPKDGFGMRGARLKTSPGGSAVVKIDRLNIAERLYRVTGQGIYADSVLTGQGVPLANPVLNGQVMGQDSVDTCIYHGRLYWFWGDTGRPSYPLGHFAMAGAVSDLPSTNLVGSDRSNRAADGTAFAQRDGSARGSQISAGLDPATGVNLEYFVDKNGFSRPLCPLKEPGLVWLDGFLTVKDNTGNERIVAKYARLKDLGTVLDIGLVAFNEASQSFEPLLRCDPNSHRLPSPDFGHAFGVNVDGRRYYYFALPFPLTVRMRVEATWDSVIDPNRYELLTAISPSSSLRWIRYGEFVGADSAARAQVAQALKKEKENTFFYDAQSGKKVTPHGGSVYYNAYRRKWIAIFVEAGGESSYLGETWYAEADTPVGPWAYARKVVTHNKYSFYNPKQHPYFDKDGGRTIFFEGTYSFTFSGSLENATPRYDYNQIMYSLNLDDPRLILPAAVYQVRDDNGRKNYLLRDAVEKAGMWDSVESVACYAVEPDRAGSDLVPIYAQKTGEGSKLTLERPDQSAKPLFYAMPPSGPAGEIQKAPDPFIFLYSTEPQLREEGWVRTENPLCRVWKAPPGPLLLDAKAEPVTAGR